MKETGGRTEIIAAPVEAVIAALLDFDSYPEWSANMPMVRVVERDSDDRPHLVEFQVDAKVRRVRYVSRYSYDLPRGFDWEMVAGDVAALRGAYRFSQVPGGTRVSIEIAFEVGFYVPGPVKRAIRDQALRTSMRELRARVISIA